MQFQIPQKTENGNHKRYLTQKCKIENALAFFTYRLFFGTNKETARASSCHPCRNVYAGGFDLQSIGGTFIAYAINENRIGKCFSFFIFISTFKYGNFAFSF